MFAKKNVQNICKSYFFPSELLLWCRIVLYPLKKICFNTVTPSQITLFNFHERESAKCKNTLQVKSNWVLLDDKMGIWHFTQILCNLWAALQKQTPGNKKKNHKIKKNKIKICQWGKKIKNSYFKNNNSSQVISWTEIIFLLKTF